MGSKCVYKINLISIPWKLQELLTFFCVGFQFFNSGCNSNTSAVDSLVDGASAHVASDKGDNSIVFQLSDRDFGFVVLDSISAEKHINLSNSSEVTLYLSSISPDNEQFMSVSSTCPISPQRFDPGASCSIAIVLKPTSVGNQSTSITVPFGASIAERKSKASVVLTGVGVSPIIFDGIENIDEVTTTSVQLNWNATSDVANFLIYSVDGGGNLLPLTTAAGNAGGATLSGLTPSARYRFRVNAYDNYGGVDKNTKVVEVTTDDLGTFDATELSGGTEGGILNSDLNCHDSDFNLSTLSILTQTDSVSGAFGGAGCSIENGYQLQCAIPYKTGHQPWTAQIEVQCLLNGSTLRQTISLEIADSNRSPRLATISNSLASYPSSSAVLAGISTVSLDFNGVTASPAFLSLGDLDEDGDPLTYTCKYQTGDTLGSVQGIFTDDCSGVLSESFSFSSSAGIFSWKPRYVDGSKYFSFQMSATETGTATPLSVSTSFIVKVNFAGQPILTFSPSNLDFGTVTSGASSQLTTTVTNTSQSAAAISGAMSGISSPFSLVTHNCSGTLLPTQTCQITLQYAPNLSESQSGAGVINYGSQSAQTDITSLLPLVGYTNPAAPSNFKAVSDAGGTSFTLSWTDLSNNESGIEIQRCDGAVCASTFTAASTLTIGTASTTTVGWASLTEGNVYRFRVRAVRGSSASAWVSDVAQVLFGGITNVTGIVSDTVTLNWNSVPNAGSFVVTNLVSGTPSVISNVSGAVSSVVLSGLTAQTFYKFRVNVVRGDGIGDSNVDDRNTTTSQATAIHLGWTHVQALGARVASIQVPAGDTTFINLNSSAKVTLKWNAMTVGGGSNQYYAIYRSTSPGGQDFSVPPLGTTADGTILTYTDTTVAGKTTYYYIVRPVVGGASVATLAADSEIKVMVPPDNMALIHRWMANQDICGLMGRTADRTNNYRCSYTGPTSVNDGGTYYYDFGKHLFVDRYEAGCNYTYSASGDKCGSANGCIGRVLSTQNSTFNISNDPPTAALASANTGDVYYDRYAARCWIKSAGSWKAADNTTLSDTEQALMYSNAPGLPPMPRVFSTSAAQLCTSTNIAPFGTKRLPSRREAVVYAAWDGSLSDAQITALEYQTGTTLNATGRCHTSFTAGHGLTFENADFPSDATNINKMDALSGTGTNTLPPGSTGTATMNYNDAGWKAVRTGSYATRNCVSRYGVQDAVGNMPDQTADSFIKSAANTDGDITFTTSYKNGADRVLNDLLNLRTNGSSLTNQINSSNNGVNNLNLASAVRFLPAIGFPVGTTDPAGLDSIPIDSTGNVGTINPALFHGDNIGYWTWFWGTGAAGDLQSGGGYYGYGGTGAGRWSASITTTGADPISSAMRGFRCVLDAE